MTTEQREAIERAVEEVFNSKYIVFYRAWYLQQNQARTALRAALKEKNA